ncbi:MAG: DUF1295 domain-containing protein [Archangium sp.]
MSVAVVEKRPWAGFALVGLAYVIAHAAGAATLSALQGRHPLFAAGAADVAGTIAIFAFSRAFSNTSFYDAYWSVAPWSIVGWLTFGPGMHDGVTTRQLVIFALVSLWAARLTFNWARGWTGLTHEDWRYVDLRKQTGKLYWVVSFFALHLMPTALVFIGVVPLYTPLVEAPAGFGVFDVVAAVVTLGAIVIETVADEQLRNFRRSHPDGGICNVGLWSWSRHPNYFGEIGFWVGLALFGYAAGAPWWAGIGALSMIALFVGASIPMAEKRSLARRPAYAEHQKKVSMLVPLPPR